MIKLVSMLGICRKAGKLEMGFDPVCREMHKGSLIVLASDLSPKTAADIERKALENKLPVKRLSRTMDELWVGLGKRVGILMITDRGLSQKIAAMIDDHDKEE